MQAEATRNRLLRRADWRFLLPDPNPRQSISFATGALHDALSAISERVLTPPHDESDCDLAVAAEPDAATLRVAWRALRADGVLYSEWHTRQIGGARAIRARLLAAGFLDVEIYWAWPSPQQTNAQLWLPLDARRVLHYFSASRVPTRARSTRLARLAFDLLWRTGLHTQVLAPLCVVARKSRTSARPARLLFTRGRRSENKAITFLFDGEESAPRIVLKQSRTPEAARALRDEAAALRALAAMRPQLCGLPRVMAYEECGPVATLAQTAAIAQPIYVHLQHDRLRPLAMQVTHWLAELAGRPPLLPKSDWWPRVAAPLLAAFEQNYGAVVAPELLQQQRALLDTLDRLPAVCEHRDFHVDNVYIAADGKLNVLDWEAAELRGLPALDLVFMLTYMVLSVEHTLESPRPLSEIRAVYRRAVLDPASATGRIVHDSLAEYAQRVGFEHAALRPLRVLTWLIHMRWQYLDRSADAGGTPSAETLRQSLFLNLWHEELHAASAAA